MSSEVHVNRSPLPAVSIEKLSHSGRQKVLVMG